MKRNLVVISGAGVSADSGLKTFRDNDGLWEGHSVTEVATPQAWEDNPERVLRFYNERRCALEHAVPNAGHLALSELERAFNVSVVTQNVDDLHERAGSSSVLHLHGELTKVRSSKDESYTRDIGYQETVLGDCCPLGFQLRPDIVWFGEPVPRIEQAAELIARAAIVIVVGTSLQVYPAAGLLYDVPPGVPIYLVDPHRPEIATMPSLTWLKSSAAEGLPQLVAELL